MSAAISRLTGTLNVSTSAGGCVQRRAFTGSFNYSGTLTNNGLTVGTIPVGELSVRADV